MPEDEKYSTKILVVRQIGEDFWSLMVWGMLGHSISGYEKVVAPHKPTSKKEVQHMVNFFEL